MIVDRSLKIKSTYLYSGEATIDRLLNILQWLAEKGFLENTRQLIVTYNFSCSPRFVDVICSLENLEKLDLLGCKLSLEQLPRVFSSCPKLVELNLSPLTCHNWEMDKKLKNELRPGFHRLRIFKFECDIDNDSWPVIQEMLT
jgi:hypothetical protein